MRGPQVGQRNFASRPLSSRTEHQAISTGPANAGAADAAIAGQLLDHVQVVPFGDHESALIFGEQRMAVANFLAVDLILECRQLEDRTDVARQGHLGDGYEDTAIGNVVDGGDQSFIQKQPNELSMATFGF